MSAVISGWWSLKGDDGPLAGMVEPDEIGIGGHSLGDITTLGVAANSCCRDDRVKAQW